jgi:predicted nuclease of predicted toxin-antitoxin system
MKLLFDENLSFRLVEMLSDVFPDCCHVRAIGFRNKEVEELLRREHQRVERFGEAAESSVLILSLGSNAV